MTHEQFQEIIISTIKQDFGYSDCNIDMDTNMKLDLDMSSLDLIELVFYMEELCEIDVEVGRIDTMNTLGDIYAYFATNSNIVKGK